MACCLVNKTFTNKVKTYIKPAQKSVFITTT